MEWKADLIQYRLQKAKETLNDARLLASACRWNPCVNRLYYACFYIISALFAQDGISSTRHSGVRSLFNQQYVKTGKISKELASIYNDLFERRQEVDYIDFVNFEEMQVRPWIDQAEKFIDHIASLITNQNS